MNPKSMTQNDIMQLQRSVGNQAFQRLMSEVSSKNNLHSNDKHVKKTEESTEKIHAETAGVMEYLYQAGCQLMNQNLKQAHQLIKKGGIRMKINNIIYIAAIIVVILIIILIVFVFSSKNSDAKVNMKEVATIDTPVTSPSGKYQLKILEETINGVKNNKFAIYKMLNGNPDSTAIFISDDVFRTRDKLFFLWDDNDRVWIYSGDVGTYFWERITDDNWQKQSYADNKNVTVPDLIKKLKPGYYENN